MSVANIIYGQLGGSKFAAMTGSKPIRCDDNGITFKLTKNKSGANELKITLNGLDLYDIEFSKHSYPRLNTKTYEWMPEKKKVIKEYKDIYCDQLEELFTEVTGLYTRLF